MNRKHYILIGASVLMALLPVFSSALVPIAVVGAALGVGALFWAMRSVAAAQNALEQENAEVKESIEKAKADRDAAVAHANELDAFFKDNGYAELTENRQRIAVESADFEKQLEVKRTEFEQEMERQCAEYEKNLAERNAEQEKVLQEKTILQMKLQKEIDKLAARRDGAIEFVQKYDDAQKKYMELLQKFTRTKRNFDAVEHCLANWIHLEDKPVEVLQAEVAIDDQNMLDPIGEIELKAMSMPDLRKEARQISKRIDSLCDEFSLRYQTKALKSIFAVTVLYLKLELL